MEDQRKYLNSIKTELGLTWDQFAERIGMNSRTFKVYRLPESSNEYRELTPLMRIAIEQARANHKNRDGWQLVLPIDLKQLAEEIGGGDAERGIEVALKNYKSTS